MRKFDKTDHARKLLEMETIVGHAYMLAAGMSIAGHEMTVEKTFIEMSIGAFGVIGAALDIVQNTLSETGSDFVYSNGLSYPLERRSGIDGQ